MDRRIRSRLDMVDRAYAFSQQHPSQGAAYVAAVATMGALLATATASVLQEEARDAEARAGVATKQDLTVIIRENYLGHLARLAPAVAPKDQEVRAKFLKPRQGLAHQEFLATSRTMAIEGKLRKQLFIDAGLPDTFFAELDGLLQQYAGAAEAAGAARGSRVGANAELQATVAELMAMVKVLDALNQYRFEKDPDLLAAWKTARKVRASGKTREVKAARSQVQA